MNHDVTQESRVTAIVSAYFCAPFIRRRLDNILAQSLVPYIVIVAQQGSEEASEVAKWRSDNPIPSSLLLTSNVPTVYDAWNKAITHSEGTYITNANSDDLYTDPDALRKMAHLLDHTPVAAVYANVDVVDANGRHVGTYDWKEGGFKELMQGCFLGPMPMWRRNLHETYGLFDGSLAVAGDYEFWLRIAEGGERFEKIPGTLGVYCKRPDSREHRQPLLTTIETARVRARYREIGNGRLR